MHRAHRLIPFIVGVALAGCASTPECSYNCTTYPTDVRERHPIILSEQPQTLDVFPRWAFGLDERQADDVRAFGQGFKQRTMSRISVGVPAVQGRPTPLVKSSADAVHKIFAGLKIDHRAIEWKTYDATALGRESPIRLSYSTITASVPHACNQWPEDLSVGSGFQWFQNEAYYSLGCSTQANLAQGVADPLDLVRPRLEGPADTGKRVQDIAKVRDGMDPSTAWKASGSQNGASGASQGGS